MRGLRFLIAITQRQHGQAYMDFFSQHGVDTVFASACTGTASHNILEYLSLNDTEKVMFQAFVPTDKLDGLLRDFVVNMRLTDHGNGIAITVPVDGIGGKSALNYFIGDTKLNGEDDNMDNVKYTLIVTVVNKGFTDDVMDAARAVNARGGTIIRARGTGSGYEDKFFGVSITEEKEMVYIVAKMEDRDEIMHAIMDKAGYATEARGAVFSLPVDSVTGVRSLTE